MRSAQIILASQSPRRRQLLDQIGVNYNACGADIDESVRGDEKADVYAERMAREKAEAVWVKAGIPVLGADTVVVVGNQVLGKPGSRAEAIAMLSKLSGCQHRVITAVAVITPEGECLQTLNTTIVELKVLSQTEIESYCESDEPLDKAGAYGIQGQAGMFVSRLDGSYSCVMGLPLYETSQLLRKAGVAVPAE